MKGLFICATPYHILNAINFVNNNKSDYDICIMPDFEDAENIVYSLREMNIFKNVFLLNEKNSSYTKLKSFYRLIAGSNYIRKLFEDRVYEEVFYCFTNPVLYTLIVEQLKKYNKKIKCFFIEDGIGTYTSYLERITPKMRSFYNLLGKIPTSDKPDGVYFYTPDLVKKDYNCRYFELPKLDNVKNSPEVLEKVNGVLGYKDSELYSKKVIYLEQPLYEDGLVDMVPIESKVLSAFKEKGLDPVIKLHPRSTNINAFSEYDIVSDKIPFELAILNNDMSDNIFVTPFSTAAVTPKLIFNQEPRLIFLYKLYNLEEKLPELKLVEEFILSVKNKYSDRSRVQIPSTFEELAEILKID